MDHKMKKAMESIDLIRNSIEDTKVHFHGVGIVCFVLGIYHTVSFLFMLLSVFVPKLFNVYLLGNPILSISFYITCFLVLQKEKRCMNQYYLSLVSTLLTIAIVLPIMISLVQITSFFLVREGNSNAGFELYAIQSFSNILLFCIFLIVASYILQKSYLRKLSAIILFAFLLLQTSFVDVWLPLPILFSENVTISIVGIYHFLVTCVGYFMLGLFIRKRENYEN